MTSKGFCIALLGGLLAAFSPARVPAQMSAERGFVHAAASRAFVINLKLFLRETPEGLLVLARIRPLERLTSFDPDFLPHRYTAGALKKHLPSDIGSKLHSTDAQERAQAAEALVAAYKKAQPAAVAFAREQADQSAQEAARGSLSRNALERRLLSLSSLGLDLFGPEAAGHVQAVRDLAAAARADKTMDSARVLASKLLNRRQGALDPRPDAAVPGHFQTSLRPAGLDSADPTWRLDASRGPMNPLSILDAKNPEDIRSALLHDIDVTAGALKVQYAPADWKKKHHQWDLDKEVAAAKQEVSSWPAGSVSVKKFHRVLRRLIQSAKDYHTSMFFASTEAAYLPFQIQGASGRYFLVTIDRDQLPKEEFAFEEGDELVEFGGRPAHEVVQELKREIAQGAEATDQALAEYFFTRRAGAMGITVPQGKVILTVRPKQSPAELRSHELTWAHQPEIVPDLPIPSPAISAAGWGSPALDELGGETFRLLPHAGDMFSRFYAKLLSAFNENEHSLGSRESYIPPLGPIEWRTYETSQFDAYIFKAPDGRRLGYLRIPSYLPENPDEALQHLARILSKLESETEGLVIDQIDNPGGSVFYLYALVSMFADKPLAVPKHEVAITQSDFLQAVMALQKLGEIHSDEEAQMILGPSMGGLPVDYKLVESLRGYFNTIVRDLRAGRTLTDAIPLYGLETIEPSRIARYTKPILMVTNALDFSGGDFGPAIFQDNGRAKTFGGKTAGAGGFVTEVQFPPNLSGVLFFTMTGSRGIRPGGKSLEDLGVNPDTPYQLTPADIQNGYKDYAHAIVEALLSSLPPRPAPHQEPKETPPVH